MFFSLIFNSHGEMISAKMEKDFREDARIKVGQAANFINKHVEIYDKEGPKAFVDSFGSLLNDDEKKFLIKELKGLHPFPRLKMKEDKLIVYFNKNQVIAELDSYEVAQGVFQGGPFNFVFDENLSLIDNIQNWKNTPKESFLNNKLLPYFRNFLIPQAEAFAPVLAIPIAAALGSLMGLYFKNKDNKPKVASYNSSRGEPDVPITDIGHGANNEGKAGETAGTTPIPSSSVKTGKKDTRIPKPLEDKRTACVSNELSNEQKNKCWEELKKNIANYNKGNPNNLFCLYKNSEGVKYVHSGRPKENSSECAEETTKSKLTAPKPGTKKTTAKQEPPPTAQERVVEQTPSSPSSTGTNLNLNEPLEDKYKNLSKNYDQSLNDRDQTQTLNLGIQQPKKTQDSLKKEEPSSTDASLTSENNKNQPTERTPSETIVKQDSPEITTISSPATVPRREYHLGNSRINKTKPLNSSNPSSDTSLKTPDTRQLSPEEQIFLEKYEKFKQSVKDYNKKNDEEELLRLFKQQLKEEENEQKSTSI